MNESSDPAGGHLSPDEIAAALESNDSVLPPERTKHAKSYDSSKSLLAMNNEEDLRIRKLAAGPSVRPEPNCPETSELAMLAAGLVSEVESQRLLAHASTCDCCGAILRAATNDFSADPQPVLERETLLKEIDDFLVAHEVQPFERQIFWLHYRQGVTAKAIAALPGIDLTAKGVESLLRRLTMRLRTLLIEKRRGAGNGLSLKENPQEVRYCR